MMGELNEVNIAVRDILILIGVAIELSIGFFYIY